MMCIAMCIAILSKIGTTLGLLFNNSIYFD